MHDGTRAPRQRPPHALGALAPLGPTLDRLDPDRALTAHSRKARAVVAVTHEGVARW